MASTTSSRSRRFALPDLKDERADGVIEAYLDGPKVRKARPRRAPTPKRDAATPDAGATAVGEADAAAGSPGATPPATGQATSNRAVAVIEERDTAVVHGGRPGDAVALRTMPGRLAWNDALDRESTRSTRYGRPSAVAIFELRPMRPSATMDSWVRTHANPIGQVLLRMSRATDIVARVADTRFQVLLPETNRDGAGEFAERVAGEFQHQLSTIGAPIRVDVSVAASSTDTPLHDAVSQAIRSIDAA
jgi:Diguanylate cyclase, GGDEF domain